MLQAPFLGREVFFALVALALYGAGLAAGRGKARHEGNWYILDYSWLLLALTGAGLFLAVFLVGKVSLPAWQTYLAGGMPRWGAQWVPTLFAAGMAVIIAAGSTRRTRFNDRGIEFSALGRRELVRWRDIKDIQLDTGGYTGLAFAKVATKTGRYFTLPQAMRGFRELVKVARQHGVAVKD